MKSLFISLFILLSVQLSFGQIPAGYYSSAENTAGIILKFELNQIIDNHIEFPYTSSSTDTWDILKETDKDPNNSNNVILIYSGVSVNGAQEYSDGNGWTREHIWAKSRGDFGTTTGPGTDVHALRPLDNTTNSIRNNRGFDDCNDCSDVYDQWSNLTGSKKDNVEWSFEARPEVKGDVARMIFYMAVRYEGYDSYPDLEISETILGVSDNSPFHGILSTLLDWHRNDPVDSWEENRNDIIYNNYQNNRNPFIDYPELAEYIWGNQMGQVWNSTLSAADENLLNIQLFPNPALNKIYLKRVRQVTNIEVYSLQGQLIYTKTIDQDSTIDLNLSSGIYFVKMTSEKESKIEKLIVR